MEKIKVSVIIPVYNTALYLKESVGSILKQTLQEIEIIIVNDASTDNSLEILEEFAAQDSRINVFTNVQNSGISISRNLGIEKATGEYIYFFDSDDKLEKECLELCYKKSKEENLDVLFFDADIFFENNLNALPYFKPKYQRTYLFTEGVYQGVEILEMVEKNKLYTSSVCLNFINFTFFEDIKLTFYPGIFYEDELFNVKLYVQAKRVGFIPAIFFHRRVRENSVMTSGFFAERFDNLFAVITELITFRKNLDKREKNALNLRCRKLLIYLTKQIIRYDCKIIFIHGVKILKLYAQCLY